MPIESFIIERLAEGGWRVTERCADLTDITIADFVSLRDAQEWVNWKSGHPTANPYAKQQSGRILAERHPPSLLSRSGGLRRRPSSGRSFAPKRWTTQMIQMAFVPVRQAAPAIGRREGCALEELGCHLAPPIPPATSCAASARPLPSNNLAPSCRSPPRTSACSPVRGRNLRDNAFRARTRERTSTGSAIWPNPGRSTARAGRPS
jgi:hypothetical protein